jgi:hypothetical protein
LGAWLEPGLYAEAPIPSIQIATRKLNRKFDTLTTLRIGAPRKSIHRAREINARFVAAMPRSLC